MRKFAVTLFSFAVLMLFLLPAVAAKESAGIGPDSAFWSMDLFFEKLNLWLTFDPAERVRINLAHADERAHEAETAKDASLERVVAQREIDVTRAQTEFSALKRPEKISAEVKLLVDEQQDAFLENDAVEEDFFEQDEDWNDLLKDVPEVATTIEPTNAITGAVVADEVTEESTDEPVETIEQGVAEEEIAQEEEEIISMPLKISAFVQGGEVTRLNISINGEMKKLTLAIIDYNATIKEVMKRYNLSYADVKKAITWKEE